MPKFRLANLDDTDRFAVAVAAMLRDGDVVLFDGEIGAGKTTTTKLIATALGVTDDVTSPTYTLVHSYAGGRFAVHHADLYRLKQTSEIEDLGLEELLATGGVLLIEWGAPADTLFKNHLFISFTIESEDARTVTVASRSESWQPRINDLKSSLKDLVV